MVRCRLARHRTVRHRWTGWRSRGAGRACTVPAGGGRAAVYVVCDGLLLTSGSTTQSPDRCRGSGRDHQGNSGGRQRRGEGSARRLPAYPACRSDHGRRRTGTATAEMLNIQRDNDDKSSRRTATSRFPHLSSEATRLRHHDLGRLSTSVWITYPQCSQRLRWLLFGIVG